MIWTSIRRSIAWLLTLVLLGNVIAQGGTAACSAASAVTAQTEMLESVG